MSSSDAMIEASSVYFQYVNEEAAHVKIDRVSRRCRPGHSKSLMSVVVGWILLLGFMNENQQTLGV